MADDFGFVPDEDFGFVPDPDPVKEVPIEKGFFSRVGEDWSKRAQTMGQTVNPIHGIGQVAGAVNDIGKEALSSWWEHRPDTSVLEQNLSDWGNYAAQNPIINRFAIQPAKAGMAKIQSWEKQYPEATKYAEDVGNIVGAFPVGKALGVTADIGKDISGAGIKGAKYITQAGGELAGRGTGSAIKSMLPSIDQETAELAHKAVTKYGIPLNFQELSNSPTMTNIQKISKELPFSGEAKFQDKQFRAINKGVANSFGQDVEKITPNVIGRAYKDLGKKFDNIFGDREIVYSPDNISQLRQISESSNDLGKDVHDIASRQINKIIDSIGDSGTINGKKAAQIRNQIQEFLRKNKSQAGEAADEYVSSALDKFMDGAFDGLPPEVRDNYSNLKYQYKNLIAATPVAGKAIRGNVNPTLLEGAVKRIYGEKAYATGEAGDLGDLAKIGKTFLPKLGGSDTLQKGLYTGAIAAPLTAFATTGPAGAAATLGLEGATAAGNRLYQAGNRNQWAIKKYIQEGMAKGEKP